MQYLFLVVTYTWMKKPYVLGVKIQINFIKIIITHVPNMYIIWALIIYKVHFFFFSFSICKLHLIPYDLEGLYLYNMLHVSKLLCNNDDDDDDNTASYRLFFTEVDKLFENYQLMYNKGC